MDETILNAYTKLT